MKLLLVWATRLFGSQKRRGSTCSAGWVPPCGTDPILRCGRTSGCSTWQTRSSVRRLTDGCLSGVHTRPRLSISPRCVDSPLNSVYAYSLRTSTLWLTCIRFCLQQCLSCERTDTPNESAVSSRRTHRWPNSPNSFYCITLAEHMNYWSWTIKTSMVCRLKFYLIFYKSYVDARNHLE